MITRMLTIIVPLCMMCACSFDSTFFPVDERADDNSVSNQETIVLQSADGKSIQHVLLRPPGNPKATIFVFHGSGSKASNWTKSLGPLLQDDYQLFLMEYRGFGESEGEASHEKVVEDACRALLYLVSRADVKHKPLLLFGQSYGGQLAISVAAKYPDQVDALVTEGAFTTFKDIAVNSSPWFGKPFTWAVFSNPYNSKQLIEKATVPKLIIHSEDDDVVPFFMGEELFEAAGGDKKFWKIHGKHTDALVDYPEEFVSRLNNITELARSN